VLTDAFVGHINRDNLGQYLGAEEIRDGLYATLFMILDRLRQATLGNDFDPRVLGLVVDDEHVVNEPIFAGPDG
jgi:hypothetical protein